MKKKSRTFFVVDIVYLALCLLLGVCAIYIRGDWFVIPALAVLLGLVIVFVPIYIFDLPSWNNHKYVFQDEDPINESVSCLFFLRTCSGSYCLIYHFN